MLNRSKGIAYSCLAVLVALYVVGAVSNCSLRQEVPTLPLWFPIVIGFRQGEFAKWSALPCLFFWLYVVVSIWLFLLGWAHILTGHFTPIEIAMTVLIGIACVFGISQSFRWKTSVRPALALKILILFVALQLLALKVSWTPYIARDNQTSFCSLSI